jgi:hypothetical protein
MRKKIMKLNFTTLLMMLMFLGCQSAPTKLTQEVGRELNNNTVLADTRSALEYATYHVPGSITLNHVDFIILKNPATGQRILDPDIQQMIERLAKKGISPIKKIVLISTKKDSEENKKWRWLLRKLNVMNIEFMSLDEYIATNKPLRPQAMPERTYTWTVNETKPILDFADKCFVNWSDAVCNQ